MPRKSAGILLFRKSNGILELLLVHPGGPFWSKKDEGAWSIPKGEINEKEDPFVAAKRELEEETGIKVEGEFISLSPIRQKGGKWVYAWAIETDFDPAGIRSNVFEMEWPPKSGTIKTFPEIDKAAWFKTGEAKKKILGAQLPLLDELEKLIQPGKP